MKTRFFLTLGVLLLVALATGLSASASSGAAPVLQDGGPPAEVQSLDPLAPDASSIVVGPHVQNVAKTTADILWEAAGTPATTYLHYRKVGTTTWTQYTVTGTNANIGPGTRPAKYIYKRSLAGLLANTKYEYQISANNTTWTPATPAVFITAPGATTAYSVADWGDSQPLKEYPNPVDTSKFVAILAKMKLQSPRIALTTGDRVERGMCYEDWKPDYFTPAASLIQNTSVFPGFGNHEDDARTGNCATNTQRMWYDDYFTWPGKLAGKHWYAFTYGCVRYVALDTNVDFWTDAAGTQLRWLKTELASTAFTSAKWQIVFMHHPAYSCTAPGVPEVPIRQKIQSILVPLFEQYKVDLVQSGHRHNYERSLRNGITYIVSGGGGGLLDNFESSCTTINPDSKKRVKNWNFVTFNFKCTDPASLTIKPIAIDGTTIETVTLTQTPPSGTCKSFQDGVAPTVSYAGTRDAYVHEHYPSNLYGTKPSLNVDGEDPAGSGHQVDGLLQWDISSIPSGSTVTSAVIDTWVTNHSLSMVYEIYETTKAWTETTVKWSNKPTAAATVLGTMSSATAPALYSTTLNSAGKTVVQKWVNTPAVNFGLVIKDGANTNGFDFDARESTTASHRPKLTVCYNPPTASVLTEIEGEVADVPVEEPEATEPYAGLNSFGGVSNQGLGDATTPLAGVSMSLYGRQEGEEAPGALLATTVSDEAGAFGFQATEPWLYDFFVVAMEPPAGLANAGAWAIEGSEVGDNSYEWYRPQPDFYAGEFHFDVPLAPEEPLPEPEVTHYLWLPSISR